MSFKTFNHTVIVGRLGVEPQYTKTANETEIVTLSVSNDVRVGDKEETQWHTVKVFGKQAVACNKYLKKGDLCCIEGHLDAHTYEKDGQKHKLQTIIAERVIFLSKNRTTEPIEVDDTEVIANV